MKKNNICIAKFLIMGIAMILLCNRIVPAQVSVSLPALTVIQGSAAEWINVTVGNLTGQNISAFQFTITYDKSVIFIDSAISGALASGGSLVFDADTASQQINVAFATSTALSGSGTLVQLKVHFVNSGTSQLAFNSTFEFNNGTPAASVTEGSIKITGLPPVAATMTATNIGSTSATINGLVNANGSSTTVEFDYGTSTSYGNSVTASQSPVTGSSNVSVSVNLTGLTQFTEYHYRVKATNSNGTNYGEDLVFTTYSIPSAPTVSTLSASTISSSSSTLNGTVNANNLSTSVQFDYGTTTSYGTSVTASQSPVTGSSNVSVSANLTGLTPATLYHFRCRATNLEGTTYGADSIFTTLNVQLPPVVTTLSAATIGSTSSTLNGTVNANGASTAVQFDYGTTTSYGTTITASQSPVTGSTAVSVSANLTGLTQNTLYHFRVEATNSAGTNYGADSTFTTLSSNQTWLQTNGPYPYEEVLTLAINPSGYIFAGTNGNGAYLSTNNGTSWTELYNGLTNSHVRSLAINSSGYIFAGTDGGVNISTNNGANWSPVNSGFGLDTLVQSLAINSSGYIFAGTAGGGIFLSTNNGSSWTQVNNGLTNNDVHSLVINSSGYIFAGTAGGGVFLSTNKGSSWSAVNTGLTNSTILSLAVNPSGSLFAGTYGGGIFLSSNNGTNWTAQNNGLPGSPDIYSLAINSAGYIFAGLGGANLGVYASTDNGSSWTLSGLSSYNVAALAVNSSGYIFAGTYEGGVYRTSNPTVVYIIPPAPIPASPADGSTGASISPTLAWNASTGAVGYRLQVSTDSTFATTIVDTSGITAASKIIINLSYQVKYFWRVNATNSAGTSQWSGVWNFTTTASTNLATPTTRTTTNITQTTATLNGVVNSNGASATVQFDYGTTASYGLTATALQSPVTGSSNANVSVNLSGLTSNTLYHYRVRATNINGTSYGADSTFTTLNVQLPPKVSTLSTTSISSTTAILNGTVNANGLSTTVQFDYGTTTSYGTTVTASQSPVTGDTAVSVSANISNLTAYTLYHFRVKAINSGDTTYGTDNTFTTNFIYPTSISLSQSYIFADPTKSSSFKLIGLPGNINTSLSQLITGTAKQDWDAYYDNGDTSNYLIEFNNSSTFTFKPGNGFWVISRNAINISQSNSTVTLNSDNSYSIALNNGWNIISNPFDKSVTWDSVISANSLSSNLIIYGWNAAWTTPGSFDPYNGYYFYNQQNLSSLKIPYNPNGTISKTMSKSVAFNEKTGTASLRLSFNSGSEEKSFVIISIDSTSGNDYYKHDIIAPPGDFEDAGMTIQNDKLSAAYKNLLKESRPMIGDGQAFDINITNKQKENATLNIEGVNNFKGYEVYLSDSYNYKLYNLKENNVIGLTPLPGSSYRVLIGNTDFIKEAENAMLPKGYNLYQNYPNPFNPVTTIEYSIPKTGFVTLKIYNILGKEVAALVDEQQTAGYYRVTFPSKGNYESGVYFYRIQAGSFTQTKKLLLIK